MYEKILKIAEKIAREIHYEPIIKSRGGEVSSAVSGSTVYWILATHFWNDGGIWIDTENWID